MSRLCPHQQARALAPVGAEECAATSTRQELCDVIAVAALPDVTARRGQSVRRPDAGVQRAEREEQPV
eukprot:14009712-Alexandrium_andersonii.AAC.1